MADRIPVLIDTDANNELDDQHAIAYTVFSSDVFELVGVTVNNTPLGNGIQGQYDEAKRVLQLCTVFDTIPLLKGAEANYVDIQPHLKDATYDGKAAVDFIIRSANASTDQRLTVIPIGKLTNIALALDHAPEIAHKIRIVWLGSNYPDDGEYNLMADVDAVNRVLDSDAPFEVVTVRYDLTTGSTAVAVDTETIKSRMPGQGPASTTIEGRNGGMFTCFGDYSVSLFEEMNFPKRPLFDVVAVAVVKNSRWGESHSIPAPILNGKSWKKRADNPRRITLWENFDRDAILGDFFQTMENFRLPG